MRLLQTIIYFFINSNLLISFCAVAFFLSGARLLGIGDYSSERAVLIFSATFLTYNLTIFLSAFNRQEEKARGKMAWFQQNRKILLLMLVITFFLLLFFFPYSSIQESLFLLHLGVISVLYNIPDRLANTRYRSIRSIPLIKIFLISYVWAALGAWYPAILEIEKSSDLLFLFFFLFILAITLPFDIRDYHSDRKSNLLTVPGLVGIPKTKMVAVGCMLLYGIGMVAEFFSAAVAVLTSLSGIVLIVFSSAKRPAWYYTGLIDSLIILQYFLIWFMN